MLPIVIVGAGPAGMMLAYQLATNGIPVRVLERHKDFDREFRGEFAQPSLIEALDAIGILEPLRQDGRVMPIRAVRMYYRTRAFASNVGPGGAPAGEAIHQPSLLRAFHHACESFPHYRLDLGAAVTGTVADDAARISGVRARIGGNEEQIDARYVVVCNGRGSALRKSLTATVDELEKPYSLLWLRFDVTKRPELAPDTLDGFVMPRGYYVLYPTYGNCVQLMWSRPRKHPLDWKGPSSTLRRELLADAPKHWLPIFETMNDDTERQLLRVVCDRLQRWHAAGVLFLGDAAHTMSPIGGQGLTLAVRDSIVAANHIISAHRAGSPLDDSLSARIEADRRPEVEKMQAFQARAGRIRDAPPAAQWLMSRVIIPLATRLQGASYLRELQHGVTDVKMTFPVRVPVAGGGPDSPSMQA
jgi:2-polyprenyl-6-methoxyphenol hydroxylase-like FAD-dependent oxidoreductase